MTVSCFQSNELINNRANRSWSKLECNFERENRFIEKLTLDPFTGSSISIPT